MKLRDLTPNWGLMRHPHNYLIIFLMVAIFLFACQIICDNFGPVQAQLPEK